MTIIARGYLFHDKDGNILKDNTEWVHLPVANFDCYYNNTNFSKKWLSKIPDTILEREVASGICRVKLKI